MVSWWMVFQGIVVSRVTFLWKVFVEGREKAKRGTGYVIVANHQSMLDIVVMNLLKLNLRWVSKIEVFKIPLLGWTMLMANYIKIERGSKQSAIKMLDHASDILKDDISVVLFPEGTRSRDGSIGKFKAGAFQLAIRNDKPILPVILDGTGDVLPKNGWRFTGGHKIRVRVLDPVHPGSFGTGNPDELAQKFHALMSGELEKMRKETLS